MHILFEIFNALFSLYGLIVVAVILLVGCFIEIVLWIGIPLIITVLAVKGISILTAPPNITDGENVWGGATSIMDSAIVGWTYLLSALCIAGIGWFAYRNR